MEPRVSPTGLHKSLTTLAVLLGAGACTGDAPRELPPLPPRVADAAMGEAGPVAPLRELVVALTGEVRGEIEPCGCPTVPYGGMARRERLLDGLRGRGVPVFVLDAGEMLTKGGGASPDAVARAEAVLDMAEAAGLDAWAASPLDLRVLGEPRLRERGALSASLEGFRRAVVVERGGVRLGVVGLSGDQEDADAAIASVRAAMTGEADAWIALSNASPTVARAVAEGVRGLGAVLSVRGTSHDPPLHTAGAPVVETPDRGRYVTLLHVALGSAPGPWAIADDGVWKGLATERALWASQEEPDARAASAARVAAVRSEVERATAGRNVAWVEDRPLGSELDAASPVDALVADFKDTVEDAATARVAAAPEATWQTAAGCFKCHERHLAAWSLSPHARAHEPLLARGKALDPECVGCHTTAWGEPGGFTSADAGAIGKWKGVQCEACHGALGGHPQRAEVQPAPVTERTCARCHDAANSPQFDYTSYLKRVSCVNVD
jgi:hypothetical protein